MLRRLDDLDMDIIIFLCSTGFLDLLYKIVKNLRLINNFDPQDLFERLSCMEIRMSTG